MSEIIVSGQMPVLALRGLVIFPKQTVHFDVAREKSIKALEAAMDALPMLDPQGRLYLPFVLAQPLPLQKAIVRRYLQNQGVPQIDKRVTSCKPQFVFLKVVVSDTRFAKF